MSIASRLAKLEAASEHVGGPPTFTEISRDKMISEIRAITEALSQRYPPQDCTPNAVRVRALIANSRRWLSVWGALLK
jgi:hypothetical protein